MRIPIRARSRLSFNLTPLIDIVFNIMVFFLVTAHFVRSAESEPIDLPSATQVRDEAAESRRLVLTIPADGTLRLAGRTVSLDDVRRALDDSTAEGQSIQVQIRSDKTVPYGTIEPLLLLCAERGVRDVGFKVFEAQP